MDALTHDLIVDLARDAVSRAAPEELPLLDPTATAYFSAPRRVREARTADDMLGFGVDTVATVLTPIALSVASRALTFIAEQAQAVLADEAGGALRAFFRRVLARFRREPLTLPSQPLAPTQLAAVRDVAYRHAVDLGTPEEKASLMADAIVGRLALGVTP